MTVRPLALASVLCAALAASAGAQSDTLRALPPLPPDTLHIELALPDSGARRDSVATPGPDSAAPAPLRVCAGGDVTLGTNLDMDWSRRSARNLRGRWNLSAEPDSLLSPLAPLVADADLLLLNVEGAIGEGPAPSKCGRDAKNCYAFRMPAAAAAALRALTPGAPVVGNLANNHARDAGAGGSDSTAALLGRAGVYVTGIDTLPTLVPTARGDTVAVLGFYTNGDASSPTPDARDLAAVRRHVARAAERWGTVIATVHIGAEGRGAQRTRNATELFLRMDRGNPVAFADSAFAGGATLVVGHGPHVLRAAEWRDEGRKLALYSLGNLLTYGPFNTQDPLNRGAIACVDVDSGRVVGAELRPTVQLAAGVLRPDASWRAAVLVDSLSRLDFPRSGALVALDGRLLRPGEPGDSIATTSGPGRAADRGARAGATDTPRTGSAAPPRSRTAAPPRSRATGTRPVRP